jgi:hypothetical protein
MWDEYDSSEVVELPGGLVLDDNHRLEWAELRPLTGREEEWLARCAGAPAAPLVTRLLASCLVQLDDTPISRTLAQRLLVGDRDFLVLQLRRITLGEHVNAVVVCPACGKNMDMDFKIDDVPVERRRQTAATYMRTVEQGSGPARTVQFRLPTGADQEAVLGLVVDEAVETLLDRCLVDAGGEPLSPKQRQTVIEAMDDLAPQLDLEFDLTCPECSHAFITPFDMTAFFFREMRANSTQLLREVHYLALYYHWSEAEILGLTRTRRRTYLALLNEATRLTAEE